MPVTLPFGELRGGSAGRQKSSVQSDFTHTHTQAGCVTWQASHLSCVLIHGRSFLSSTNPITDTSLGQHTLSWRNIGFPPAHSTLHLAHTFHSVYNSTHARVSGKGPQATSTNTDRRACQQELVKFHKPPPCLQEMCPTLSCWGWRRGTPGLTG